MPARRARLASSRGADFTSSSSWRIIPPIRITLAGCSTSSVMLRSSSDPSWEPPADAMPPGPMIMTRGSSGVPSGVGELMGPTLGGEHDLPDVVAGLHDPVRLTDLRERDRRVHEGPDRAV